MHPKLLPDFYILMLYFDPNSVFMTSVTTLSGSYSASFRISALSVDFRSFELILIDGSLCVLLRLCAGF